MYLSIQETAEYLELPAEYIEKLVRVGRIRSIFDGERYLINQNQFTTHFEQVEKYRQYIQDYLNEPIPEDPDIKDED
ncbi:excisionase family DNA-binding protein [Pontibacillus sp. ALD_SL1]|uniref:excisionase family DNA-binding protein n=1 Tax=Pontibacillus sp. ALD_SL1 TaxID=2777185 RepID=UPI001A96FCE9|nr:excisionase family DNA-binding protein [Pontibacillus sp. ALD_SL1]QST00432.1 excisionase family DNA-binding protein [Pontibacillus sp. ALD_SL1]